MVVKARVHVVLSTFCMIKLCSKRSTTIISQFFLLIYDYCNKRPYHFIEDKNLLLLVLLLLDLGENLEDVVVGDDLEKGRE